MSEIKGIRDQKGINDFVERMKHGRATAKAGRASSTAPPKPVKAKSQSTEIPSVPVADTKIPKPAKSGGMKPGSQGKHVTIHIHNH